MALCRRGLSRGLPLSVVALSLGLAAGCGVSSSFVPTAASPRAMQPRPVEDVEVFLSRPDLPLREVGMIEVQQDVFNHASANALVGELRRTAAQAGCEGVLISGANDGVFGHGSVSDGYGSMHTRTLKGYRGTCLVFTDTRQHEPPRGGGGFVFGTDVATNEAACARASRTWSAGEPGKFTCSGALADVGMNAKAVLGFCADRLCSVELKAVPKGRDAAAWRSELRELRAALQRKYGRPAGQEGVEPPDCTSGDAEAELCFMSGTFTRAIRWGWPTGERIELVLSFSQQRDGEVVYRTSELLVAYKKGAPLPQTARASTHEGL
jgi:hypothetical protein